jgi:hypothetical protein
MVESALLFREIPGLKLLYSEHFMIFLRPSRQIQRCYLKLSHVFYVLPNSLSTEHQIRIKAVSQLSFNHLKTNINLNYI